jgi:ATP-dependent DNA ligase
VPGKKAEEAISILQSIPDAAKFEMVTSTANALQRMHTTLADGGEGVMLRKPGSDYQPFRTNDLLKLKP